jgi:hypothetical protein
MTLFGAGLIAGGAGLLGYAWLGTRARKRDDRQPLRDWPAIDRTRAPGAPHRLDRLRGLPFIRRSALLDETEPVVVPPVPEPIDDTVPINRIGSASIERDDTVPIRYATPVPVRID